ncbi:MAG: hypothetical protein JWO87_2957 [Phycisphaerales bacterium]|nr:hypothetical protein [Phycisphaerales bacterium]
MAAQEPMLELRPAASIDRVADDVEPSARELWAIVLVAVLLRAALFLLVASRFHVTFDEWALRDDGKSYVHYASALLGDSSQLTDYDRRVFPGYPGLIALLHLGHVPFTVAAIAVDWGSAGAVAALAAILFRDRRIGWALTCLIPQYFMNSSLAMTEAPMLALSLAGLILAERKRGVAGGFLLGLAGLVRPMACFAVLGQIWRDTLGRRFGNALVAAAISGAVVMTGIAALHAWSGDAMHGVKVYASDKSTYNGELIVWPFKSLIHESLRPEISVARGCYVWLHVAIVLAAVGGLAVKCLRSGSEADPRDMMALPWLAGNTLFVLCIGSYWGFQHFPRFTIPALPALFWSVREFLPRRPAAWAAIAAGMLAAASAIVLKDFVVPR